MKKFITLEDKKQSEILPVNLKKIIYMTDNVAPDCLDQYGNSLQQNLYQELLDEVCESASIKPKCIMKLVELGAKLPSSYANAFLHFFLRFDKSSSYEDMFRFVKLLEDNKIKIPVTPKYFMNDDGIKQKELFVQSAFQQCNDLVWRTLETTIVQFAKGYRDAQGSLTYECALNRFHQIALDSIKMGFDTNPERKLSNPKEFEYIAFISIYKQHPLIHILLERGLKLDQTLSPDAWPNEHYYAAFQYKMPEDKAFHCTEINTLADVVAFYSSDPKLLENLNACDSNNKLGRTPLHYAVLAALACENTRIDYWLTITEKEIAKSNRKEAYHESGKDLESGADLTEDKIVTFQERNQPSYRYFYNLFQINEIITCFMPKYSRFALEIFNLSSHWMAPDKIGFSPLHYAFMLTDQTKKNEMFESIRKRTQGEFKWPTQEQTYDLIISWAEKLVDKADLFTREFQIFLIKPITLYLDRENKFDFRRYQRLKIIGLARTVLQIFNHITFAGTISRFESILAKPTDSKERESLVTLRSTRQQLPANFSSSNQVRVFSSSSLSNSMDVSQGKSKKRKHLIDQKSNDNTKRNRGSSPMNPINLSP